MKIGKKIKKLRTINNMTQQSFADKLGVHNQTVSKWEREIAEPDFAMLGFIANALAVSLEELLDVQTDKPIVNGVFDTVKMGNTIRLFRTHLNLSQSELATSLNTSSDIVSKWERGFVCPDVDKLILLASIFNISPSALYFGQAKPVKTTIVVKNKAQKRTIIIISIICALAILISSLLTVFLMKDNGDGEVPNDNPSGDQVETIPDTENNPDSGNNPITPEEPSETTFTSPLDNISVYEVDKNRWCDFHGRFCFNSGVYLIADLNDTVYSIMDGMVIEYVDFKFPYNEDIENIGGKIVIQNGDYVCTYYSVIAVSDLAVGSVIKKGDVLGNVGNHSKIYCERAFPSHVLYVTLTLDDEYLDPFEYFIQK